ncbi:MAG: hypothetical protein R3A47_09760 [Polyangiales bacterium]
MRMMGVIPVDEVVQFFESEFGKERAASMKTRFDNEETLVKRARDKLMFGWGSNCRACIFDPFSGRESIRDGDWIILGDWGVVGFFQNLVCFCLAFSFFVSGLNKLHERVIGDC